MKPFRVLITVLDWGLGHATRSIPVIQEFTNQGCEVFVAGSGGSLSLLREEFPALKYFTLPGYNPTYGKGSSLIFPMATQFLKFISIIKREHNLIEKIIQEKNIDLVISDNRYGCWSNQIPCIFITHQLRILLPNSIKWFSFIINHINRRFIRKFDACWVPDFQGEPNLAGEMTHISSPIPTEIKYIGPLSRFSNSKPSQQQGNNILVVLSGPEPQRTLLEEKLMDQLVSSDYPVTMVRGKVESRRRVRKSNLEIIDHLVASDLQQKFEQAAMVISRSGYSTIMDLYALEKKAIVIPTPGQPEQEYLAKRFHAAGNMVWADQNKTNIQDALLRLSKCTPLGGNMGRSLLAGAVTDILSKIQKV